MRINQFFIITSWTFIFVFVFGTAVFADIPPLLKETNEFSQTMSVFSNSENSSTARYMFNYFSPFFLGLNDIAVGYRVDTNRFDFEIKKWDWMEYTFSIGLKGHYLSKLNRDPRYFNSYQLADGPIDGSYSGVEVFSEYLMNDQVKINGSYEYRVQTFSKNSDDPTFLLPKNNTLHIFKGGLERQPVSPQDEDHVRSQSLEVTAVFSDGDQNWGSNQTLSQFNRGLFLEGKNEDELQLGLTKIYLSERLLVSEGDFFRLGNPSLWNPNQGTLALYGFLENSLSAATAFVGQFNLTQEKIAFNVDFHWYNTLALYGDQQNQLEINKLVYGTGLGMETPLILPFLGEYRLQSAYFVGFKDTTSGQFLINLSTHFSM